jgi:DNA replication protein DnaC
MSPRATIPAAATAGPLLAPRPDLTQLEAMLTRLKLPAIRDQLDTLLAEAARQELTLVETVAHLCAREITQGRAPHRDGPGARALPDGPGPLGLRLRRAARGRQAADPRTGHRALHREWGSRPFARPTRGRENSPERGHRAGGDHAGYSMLFTSASALIAHLVKAHAQGQLEEKLGHYTKPKLLIIDELGYLPIEPDAAHVLFQLVSRRYERGSILLTSNRAVNVWGTVFGDPVVATAILDRLLHHSHVITIRGESYRLREKRRAGLLTTTKHLDPTRPPSTPGVNS